MSDNSQTLLNLQNGRTEQMFQNLQKVCTSLVDLYTTMHTVLLDQLNKQLNFDSKTYMSELQTVLTNLQKYRSEIEDEVYGLTVIDTPIQNLDFIHVIIECTVDGKTISNRSMGGSRYTVGKHQLVPELEQILIGKVAGDKFDVNIDFPPDAVVAEYAGKNVQYNIEILTVKRKKI